MHGGDVSVIMKKGEIDVTPLLQVTDGEIRKISNIVYRYVAKNSVFVYYGKFFKKLQRCDRERFDSSNPPRIVRKSQDERYFSFSFSCFSFLKGWFCVLDTLLSVLWSVDRYFIRTSDFILILVRYNVYRQSSPTKGIKNTSYAERESFNFAVFIRVS